MKIPTAVVSCPQTETHWVIVGFAVDLLSKAFDKQCSAIDSYM